MAVSRKPLKPTIAGPGQPPVSMAGESLVIREWTDPGPSYLHIHHDRSVRCLGSNLPASDRDAHSRLPCLWAGGIERRWNGSGLEAVGCH